MKKILSLLLILTLVFTMVACGNKNETTTTDENNSQVVTEQEVQMYFSESDLEKYATTQTIKLPEDTTTGYEWVYVIDDAGIVEFVSDDFLLAEGTDTLDGGKGNRTCEIKGLAEGETIIYFNYTNGVDVEPIEVVKFYIKVNANNEIAIMDEIH